MLAESPNERIDAKQLYENLEVSKKIELQYRILLRSNFNQMIFCCFRS